MLRFSWLGDQKMSITAFIRCCAAIGFLGLLNLHQLSPARAQPLPQAVINQIPITQSGSLNLGYTSFFDGAGGTDPGLVYQSYWINSNAHSIKDGSGNDVLFPSNPHIDNFAWASEFVLTTPITVGPAVLGFVDIIPVVSTNASSDAFPAPFPPGKTLSDSAGGLGDMIFGPFLQFKPITDSNGNPLFFQRIEFDFIVPTGRYNLKNDVQPGSNFSVLNPYWALTWLPAPKWEFSTRLQYAYNFKNVQPADVPPGVYSTRAGQAIFANFTASYEILDKFHVGLNGYYLQQITQSTVNGMSQANSEAELLGLGPGLLLDYSKTEKIFVNYYTEIAVKNAAKSNVAVLRWIHIF
jgi:hypothetical protein